MSLTSLLAIITFFVRIKAAEKYVKFDNLGMLLTSGKIIVCSAFACFIPRVVFWKYPINEFLVLIVSAFIGLAIYVALVNLFKISELKDLLNIMKRKIKK